MNSKLKALLALALVLLTLVSCAPNTPDNVDGTTTEQVTTVPYVDNSLVLFDANTSYTVIRAEETNSEIKDIAADIRNKLDELVDGTVKISTDWLKKGVEPDPNALEILVANTNREESIATLEDIAYSDYAVRIMGKKVVIAAHNAENLQKAADHFINILVKDGDAFKLPNSYTFTSGVSDLFTDSNPLSGYSIIYPAGSTSDLASARTLADAIKDLCGVELSCNDDKTAATDKEILVGATSRTESEQLKSLTGLEYIIRASGTKLIIGGSTGIATELAVEKLADKFLSGIYSNSFKISSNYDQTTLGTVTLSGAEDPTLAEGADLRIMSFNILAELWDDKAKATMPGRDANVVSIILSYMPDVVGLQETTDLWYSLLEPQLEGVYKFASYKVPNGKTNYSTLMYNVNTTEFIESGTTLYSDRNSDNMRHLTWVRFRRISDGAEYIVTCTHWDITEERREVQWQENAKLINDLYAKYKVPIFATGDYNSSETSLFGKFLDATGMLDPKYDSKVINRAGKTTHTLGSAVADATTCIDHIAVTPGPELLYYNTLTCPAAIDASDHCPIYIDVKLKP
ncbi:MAG: endonuclease/exonuclease/phosphatase family protein [Clostridia bacterium]|nr:endonuclease/exonuclease/phosphatase family protein [Clostridia bacterium]